MTALVAVIHVYCAAKQDVDARDKPAHDERFNTSETHSNRASMARLARYGRT